jgi:hypothetical protein
MPTGARGGDLRNSDHVDGLWGRFAVTRFIYRLRFPDVIFAAFNRSVDSERHAYLFSSHTTEFVHLLAGIMAEAEVVTSHAQCPVL